ncbi:MAG: nitroreductase family protein [Treponema sp.]|nr:nitroreductase family protein [Treponema sp.]
MKKNLIAVLLGAALCVFSLPAQDAAARLGVILNNYSPRTAFTTGAIPRADLDLIVQAGVRTSSAGNRQPWFFTVVQNLSLTQRIIPQSVQGNVIIVISTEGTTNREIIDCALATQTIYLAAQALGYGSQIYTGPIAALNRELKGDLGLPANRNAVAVVRIGRVTAGTDAVSAASPRRSASEMVTYK